MSSAAAPHFWLWLLAILAFIGETDWLGQALFGEHRKRNRKDWKAAALGEVVEKLRAFHSSEQAAFCRSMARKLAALCTRRAGKTSGGIREMFARALETRGWRGVYVATTKDEARKRAWESDTQDGLIDLLNELGSPHAKDETKWVIGGLVATVNKTLLSVTFSNGSKIELFAADDERALRKLRGLAKHLVWVDEAQDFIHLEKFYQAVVQPLLKDYQGQAWITGTPSTDCAGYFYEITKPSQHGDRLPGWEVHTWAVTDNPFFGRVDGDGNAWFVLDGEGTQVAGPFADRAEAEARAKEVRWDRTAGEALRENSWKGDEPDFLREWRAQWVREDARYVYPVHAVPDHVLVYAPQRLDDDGWLDFDAAVVDLPKTKRGKVRRWMFAVGVDFGYFPGAFAITVWSFAFDCKDVFELWSWKRVKVLPDDQLAAVRRIMRETSPVVLVGDPGGQKGADMEGWRERLGIPIENADKAGKQTWAEMMAGDIRKGRIHYRKNSPILDEHRHLVLRPQTTLASKRKWEEWADRTVAGRTPGNHCSDAGLYAYRHLTHYLSSEDLDKPKAGTKEAYESEERAIEERVDKHASIVEAAREDGWDVLDAEDYY